MSFGTSFNDSRAQDIGGIEKVLQAAYPAVCTGICFFKVVFQLRIISENKLLFIHRVFLRGADGIQ